MSQNPKHPPHSPSVQPKADDAVLGGEASQPIDAVVLGGLEGVKRRLGSKEIGARIAALGEALQYGEAGLDLVMAALEDESKTLQSAAYSLLSNCQEERVKQQLRNRLPWFEFEVVKVDAKGQEIKRQRRQAQCVSEDLGDGVNLEMVYIPGGRFMMGSLGNYDSEWPQHEVTVQPFFIGKYPVTQAQWKVIASRADLKVKYNLDPNLACFKNCKDSERRPVERVSWYNAVEFCQRLFKLTRREYRLPSEAEWEYACRAGTTTLLYFGDTITTNLANYNGSTLKREPRGINRKETTCVGSFPANAFGLYDMHGNVAEWCEDYYNETYQGAPNDGSAWISSSSQSLGCQGIRMMRGGSWFSDPSDCRCASRDFNYPDYNDDLVGFRVVCKLPRSLHWMWSKVLGVYKNDNKISST